MGFEGKGALGDGRCHLNKEGSTEGEEGISLSLCEVVDNRILELIEKEVLSGVEVFGEISEVVDLFETIGISRDFIKDSWVIREMEVNDLAERV